MEPQGLTGKWTSEWMNTNLWSFPLCQFVPSARLCMVSFHSMLVGEPKFLTVLGWFLPMIPNSPETGIWKTPPNQIRMIWSYFVYLLEVFLNIFANQRKEDSLGQHFFFAIRMPLHLPLELNSRSFFHLYRSEPLFYSRCAPFRAWKRSQARPKSAENRSPLSAVSSTCREITWDKCYGSVRLALFTASLTKKCVVWNCALGKWQRLHNETSVTRSIWIQAKATPTSEVC